jgi:hypothetical protein
LLLEKAMRWLCIPLALYQTFVDIHHMIGFYCYQGSHGEIMEHKCLDPHVMIMMHFLKFKGDWDLRLFLFSCVKWLCCCSFIFILKIWVKDFICKLFFKKFKCLLHSLLGEGLCNFFMC